LTGELKELQPKIPVIVIAVPGFDGCPAADFHLESFNPAKLLEILRGLKPKDAARIEKHDEDLSLENLS
jgi:hypothetical protein